MDVDLLNTQLRLTEHERAQQLYERIIDNGHEPRRAVSLIYRAGNLAGRRVNLDRIGALEEALRIMQETMSKTDKLIPDVQGTNPNF